MNEALRCAAAALPKAHRQQSATAVLGLPLKLLLILGGDGARRRYVLRAASAPFLIQPKIVGPDVVEC